MNLLEKKKQKKNKNKKSFFFFLSLSFLRRRWYLRSGDGSRPNNPVAVAVVKMTGWSPHHTMRYTKRVTKGGKQQQQHNSVVIIISEKERNRKCWILFYKSKIFYCPPNFFWIFFSGLLKLIKRILVNTSNINIIIS